MADAEEIRPFEYRRLFPWLHLTRAFRMAVDPRKLLLAGLALLAIAAFDAAYRGMRFEKAATATIDGDHGEATLTVTPLDDPADAAMWMYFRGTPLTPKLSPWPWDKVQAFVDPDPLENVAELGVRYLLDPLATIAEPLNALFLPVTWYDKLFLVARLLFALGIWAIVAGAITRMVALEFARDERLGTIESIRYACSRFFSFLFAPLIAVICLGFIVLFCWLGGLVGAIPGVGPIFAGVLWFLPMLAGFVMALILVGAALGWPLMYATISTQDSDAFDGFSRSYTFVYGRPWYYALLAVVTVLLAIVGFGIVYLFTQATDGLSQGAVGLGMGHGNVATMFSEGIGSYPATFWRRTLLLLAGGFGASFFWVAATVSYFLLRRADDGTSLEEVEVQYDAPADTLAPLAGVDTAPAPGPIVELSTTPPPSSDDTPGDGDGEPTDTGDDAPAG